MGFENDDLIDLMMVFPRKASNVSRTMVSKYLGDSRIKPYHLLILRAMSHRMGYRRRIWWTASLSINRTSPQESAS